MQLFLIVFSGASFLYPPTPTIISERQAGGLLNFSTSMHPGFAFSKLEISFDVCKYLWWIALLLVLRVLYFSDISSIPRWLFTCEIISRFCLWNFGRMVFVWPWTQFLDTGFWYCLWPPDSLGSGIQGTKMDHNNYITMANVV